MLGFLSACRKGQQGVCDREQQALIIIFIPSPSMCYCTVLVYEAPPQQALLRTRRIAVGSTLCGVTSKPCGCVGGPVRYQVPRQNWN